MADKNIMKNNDEIKQQSRLGINNTWNEIFRESIDFLSGITYNL